MKVLFISYNHLNSNSGIHIFCLANHLSQLGIKCVVSVPNKKEEVFAIGVPLFDVVNFEDLLNDKAKRNFDLIHAWTPREVVRKLTEELIKTYRCPYVVHLEDNEESLYKAFTGFPFHFILKQLPAFILDLDSLMRPYLSHPQRYKKFLEKASGITVIIDSLKEFCPENIPNEVIWAGYQEDIKWNIPEDSNLKYQLGLNNTEFIVVYTGNVHLANREEIANLYHAVELLFRQGISIKLVRSGINSVRFLNLTSALLKQKYCIELGYVPRSVLPSLLSIADVLIQPGKPDQFNDFRFPSKLPEYLASGKPVILPKANIGRYLKDHDECILLEKGDANDIARKLELLLSSETLRKRIGEGGRKFAENHLRWEIAAKRLYSFYLSLDKKSTSNQQRRT